MKLEEIKFVFFGSDSIARSALLAMEKFGLVPGDKNEKCDVAVLVSYGKIITKEIIDSFKYGILNIHPSLLPALRGPSPIKSAILENLEKTGVSIMLLDEQLDHGPILVQEKIALSPRTATEQELREALFEKGAELLARVLPDYVSGKLVPIPQNHGKATYTKKFKSDDAFIPFDLIRGQSAFERSDLLTAERKVRALSEEPGTYTIVSTKSQARNPKQIRLKILKAKIENNKFVPVIVQPEGKKLMDWQAFLRGNTLVN